MYIKLFFKDSMSGSTVSNTSIIRSKILDAVTSMHNALGIRDIGRIHHAPLTTSNGVIFLVSVKLVNENQDVQGLAMRWMRMEKMIRKKFPCTALEYLCKELFTILNFFESSQIPLDPGLYVGYLRLQSTLNVIRVSVPENVPSVLPFALIRDNPHVTMEEWEWLRDVDKSRDESQHDEKASAQPSSLQYKFHQQLSKAVSVLIHDLDIEPDLIQNHRLFRLEILQLNSDVSFIFVIFF